MMRWIMSFVVIAASFSFIASTPAVADPPIGSRIDRSSPGLTGRFNSRNQKSPRPGINAYFRCLASLDRVSAAKVLDLAYMTEEQRISIKKVGPNSGFSEHGRADCFSNFGGGGVEIGFDPASAVGGFAEFFISSQFKEADAARLAELTREQWGTQALTPRNGSEMIGLCTVQATGPAVFRLTETEPASEEEAAEIQTIVPYLGPCLTEGVEVSFDVASLRALLAHSLYKALTGMEALEKAEL